jgi:hypothetical protein
MNISNEVLLNTYGGASSLSGTLINSIIKAVSFILDFGRTIGSAIRYKKSGLTC